MDNGNLNSIINVDLHVHTKASEYKDNELVANSTIENLDVLLKKLNDNEINLFAFSDHNRFDPEIFKEARKLIKDDEVYPNIKNILASVEFDVELEERKPACHIITVFDYENDDNNLNKIHDEIDKRKINKPDGFYTSEEFDNLLKSIGLSTLLIGAQRKSFEKEKPYGRSVSDSIGNIYEFCKTGYIAAFEYQKYNVQGMIKNSLNDFNLEISTVCGSDCHDWNYYPYHCVHDKHDYEKAGKSKTFFFKIKALPTFKGLLLALTSPKTRFNRKQELDNYIKSFSINGKEYNLSSGFNAIIGENGSGKTSLILGIASDKNLSKDYKYVDDIIKKNSIFSDKNVEQDKIKIVHQAELIKNNGDGKNIFGNEVQFPTLDLSSFKESVINYKKQLISQIQQNINRKDHCDLLKEKSFIYNEEYEDNDTYYITLSAEENFMKIDNPYKDRIESINGIISKIINEINCDVYELSEKENFLKIVKYFVSVRNALYKKHVQKELESNLVSNIVLQNTEYNNKIKELSTDIDQLIADYKTNKKEIINTVVNSIKDSLITRKAMPDFNIIGGLSSKEENGFVFKTIAKFYEETDLINEYYKYVFKKEYSNYEALMKLSTVDDLKNAIKATGNKLWSSKITELTNSFIDEMSTTREEMFELSTNKKIGNTLGEKAIVYYKYISYKSSKYKVLVIDQPEDNISNKKIIHELKEYFGLLRDKYQLIYVTHNPLLVVNNDVDNVICITNENDTLSVKSGCLESDGILDIVAENMDGGKEAIRKRLQIYE